VLLPVMEHATIKKSMYMAHSSTDVFSQDGCLYHSRTAHKPQGKFKTSRKNRGSGKSEGTLLDWRVLCGRCPDDTLILFAFSELLTFNEWWCRRPWM